MDAKSYARMRAIAAELMGREDTRAVEIGEGVITLTMPPVNRHELIALRLRRQIERQMADDPDWAGHARQDCGRPLRSGAGARRRRPRYRARHDYAFRDAVPVGPWVPDSGEFPAYGGS
ncbi:hypothetical protein PV350_41315 [Streptomyces sp. PA03-6a]|nr:hypothetical protein [Streptomyces sp. PA03-6a]